MEYLKRAHAVLGDAEAGLKKLLADAAENADYAAVEGLVSLARHLANLQSCGEQHDTAGVGLGGVASHREQATSRSAETKRSKSPGKASAKKRATQRRASKRPPRFVRSGDAIVKIAWSKSTKSEYRHKSPQAVLGALAEAILIRLKSREVISMDKVLPLHAADGTDIPDYQVYLCLAWLRNEELVTQKGREGYTISNPEMLLSSITAAWDNLSVEP